MWKLTFFLSHWRYSDFYFSVMLVEKFYVLYSFCLNHYICYRATKRVKLRKNNQKILLRNHKGDGDDT